MYVNTWNANTKNMIDAKWYIEKLKTWVTFIFKNHRRKERLEEHTVLYCT